jgi:ubiquinone/menaquinone biosynthesis C-methylase UbiE
MRKFQRIYWSKDFNWNAYARLYDSYCHRKGNYYEQSARALLQALKLPRYAHIIDAGAGTGALTKEIIQLRPDITITAIDLSSEMLSYYRQHFRKQISKGLVTIIKGNAEQLHRYLNKKADAILVSCAIWDMELPPFLRNARRVLKRKGKVAFNLPALVTGISRGFIWFIEQSVREVLPGEELYRRIPRQLLMGEFSKKGFIVESEKTYRFRLKKDDVRAFFKVLRYRYPFILFPKEMPYKQRLRLCTRIFNSAVKRLADNGVFEEGTVFVIRPVRSACHKDS